MKRNKLKYIDLFSGCGGLSLGLYNSKLWKGVFAIEKNPDAFKTLNHNLILNNNHFDWPQWLPKTPHDINDVIQQNSIELKNLRGKIDLIAGGPPCQGFSIAGRRIENDSRNKLIDSYVEFIHLVQPKLIFFENVKGFTHKFDKNKEKGRIYSDYVQKLLQQSYSEKDIEGYEVYGTLVNFVDYGVPQKRIRFILVGIRKDLKNKLFSNKFFKLLYNNRKDFLVNKGIGLTNNLKDAISDLLRKKEVECPDTKSFKSGLYNNPETGYQKLLKGSITRTIPDSHRFVNHTTKTVSKFEFILDNAEKNKKLSKEIKSKYNIKKHTMIPLSGEFPAPTITTLPDDYLHYCEPRILTVREYARIQSFGDWYEFKGKYTTGGKLRRKEVPRYSQIGNAIPPLFAEQVGIALRELIND